MSSATLAQQQSAPRKSEEELSSMRWQEIVQAVRLRKNDETENKEHRAKLKRLSALLDREGVTHIRCDGSLGGKKSQYADVYYKSGELCVIYSPPADGSVSQLWNLVVKNGKAYEWRTGETHGIVGTVTDYQMIEYLAYLTDPAGLMGWTHGEFLRRPEAFFPPKEDQENGWTEVRFKQSEHGINALFMDQSSAFLRGLEFVNDDATLRITFARPRSVSEIPADLYNRLNGIRFKDSTIDLRRHMTYL
ncbi:MAG: hypothetical protein R3C53_06815 [Pirellulaceae bacterium]